VSSVLTHRVVWVHRPVSLFRRNRFAGPCIDAFGHRVHRDAVVHRAHADAEITANELVVDHFEVAFAIDTIGNGLVRCVFADNMAATTLNAQILVN